MACLNEEHMIQRLVWKPLLLLLYIFRHYWRPICGIAYVFICLFDFVVMPSIIEARSLSDVRIIQLAQQFGTDAIQVLTLLKAKTSWQPLTLQAGGFFHMAFGAILGVSAWSRGKEKQDDHNKRRPPVEGDIG